MIISPGFPNTPVMFVSSAVSYPISKQNLTDIYKHLYLRALFLQVKVKKGQTFGHDSNKDTHVTNKINK